MNAPEVKVIVLAENQGSAELICDHTPSSVKLLTLKLLLAVM